MGVVGSDGEAGEGAREVAVAVEGEGAGVETGVETGVSSKSGVVRSGSGV